MIAGAAALARRNTCLTAFSESPTHLLKSSGPYKHNTRTHTKRVCVCLSPSLSSPPSFSTLTAMKLRLLSVASARAIIVLLQPGGP